MTIDSTNDQVSQKWNREYRMKTGSHLEGLVQCTPSSLLVEFTNTICLIFGLSFNAEISADNQTLSTVG